MLSKIVIVLVACGLIGLVVAGGVYYWHHPASVPEMVSP